MGVAFKKGGTRVIAIKKGLWVSKSSGTALWETPKRWRLQGASNKEEYIVEFQIIKQFQRWCSYTVNATIIKLG